MQGQICISALLISVLCISSSFACLFLRTRIVLHIQDMERCLDVYGTLAFLLLHKHSHHGLNFYDLAQIYGSWTSKPESPFTVTKEKQSSLEVIHLRSS